MIQIANEVNANSWLNESRFAWFLKGYQYASTQTRSIPALSETTPENLYFAVCSILRANGIAIPGEKGLNLVDSFVFDSTPIRLQDRQVTPIKEL